MIFNKGVVPIKIEYILLLGEVWTNIFPLIAESFVQFNQLIVIKALIITPYIKILFLTKTFFITHGLVLSIVNNLAVGRMIHFNNILNYYNYFRSCLLFKPLKLLVIQIQLFWHSQIFYCLISKDFPFWRLK